MNHRLIVLMLALCPLVVQAQSAQDATSTPAGAGLDDVEPRARELYQNGVILYDEGRYEDAILAWEEAYRLSPRPLLLFNMANALERLAQWQEALDTLSRYRAFARTDEREALDRRIRNLERRLELSQDNPTPARQAGSPDITGSAPVSLPSASDKPLARSRALPATLMTAGVVGLGTGIAFGFRAREADAEVDALCLPGEGGDYICPVEATAALDRSRTSAWIADGSFAFSALAITAGVVSVVWNARAADRGTAVGVELKVGPGRGGLALTGRFR